MSDDLQALEETVADILRDHCTPERLAAADGSIDHGLWKVLAESGLIRVGVPEEIGGSGGSMVEAAVVLRLAGEYSAPVPIAEGGVLAGCLLAAAGLPLPDGVVTVGVGDVSAVRTGQSWRITGMLPRVAYARDADAIVGIANAEGHPVVFVVPRGETTVTPGSNLAGEPRDDVALDMSVPADSVAAVTADAAERLLLHAALARAVQLAGAVEAALTLVVRYAGERKQFGRPIAAFQAVQQQVAWLAGEVAAARAAADAAVQATDRDPASPGARLAVAAAKIRTAQAAGVVAAGAHQIHGAIGMTEEHALRFTTTRLWSWREEWGSERQWAAELGRIAASHDDAGLWPLLVGA
jgi:acyl-CoA dehydrogenase